MRNLRWTHVGTKDRLAFCVTEFRNNQKLKISETVNLSKFSALAKSDEVQCEKIAKCICPCSHCTTTAFFTVQWQRNLRKEQQRACDKQFITYQGSILVTDFTGTDTKERR